MRTEVFRCDLTWLTSRWTCIFGQGCPGIYESSPDAGCCTLGAHFADETDHQRVAAVVEQLTPEDWERHDDGRADGWTETDDEGELRPAHSTAPASSTTRASFAGGYGCALHGHALRMGTKPHAAKPDVCWQLPLRRQFREVDRGDGTTYTETSIGEYTRAGWGPGGADLDWYCSSNTEAHVGSEPVYVSNRDELVELMGEPGYEILARFCAEFDRGGPHTPHLADPAR